MSSPAVMNERPEDVAEPEVHDIAGVPTVAYEVVSEFVELVDAEGHKHWLSAGDELPGWVQRNRIVDLMRAGAVLEFRSI